MALAKEWLKYLEIVEKTDTYTTNLTIKDAGKLILSYLKKRKEKEISIHDLAREVSVDDGMLRKIVTKFSNVGIFKPSGGGNYNVDLDKVNRAKVV